MVGKGLIKNQTGGEAAAMRSACPPIQSSTVEHAQCVWPVSDSIHSQLSASRSQHAIHSSTSNHTLTHWSSQPSRQCTCV